MASTGNDVYEEITVDISEEKKSGMARNASSRFKQLFRRSSLKKYDRRMSTGVHALTGLKFISKTGGGAGWFAVEREFNEITKDTDGLLPRSLFWKCIGMNKESEGFAGVLFDALVRRREFYTAGNVDSINKEQLKDFWEHISDQSFDTRLLLFFDMVDKDADGTISEEEVKEIISLSASANKLSNIQNQAGEYATLIMEELDPNNRGYILLEHLKMLLQTLDTSEHVSGESEVLCKLLSQKLKPRLDHNVVRRWSEELMYFLVDNWQRIWVLGLWIGVMAGLFAYKYIQYKSRAAYAVMGACVCLAKGGAETLKLNMALILLPVCRNTITWLRNKTRLGAAVPFGDNVNFHKVIAVAIALGVGIHGIAHLACDFPRLLHASEEEYEPMIKYFGEQPKSYWHFVKSVEGVTGLIMVLLMAISFTFANSWFRHNRFKKVLQKEHYENIPKPLEKLLGFNTFWYSHHLFVIVYALLIVHGIKLYLTREWYKKTTWMYLAVPVLLYGGERLTRALRSSIKHVKIIKALKHPGNVLSLHMSKPKGFEYKSGQYIFVHCAAVSPFEWHPFSITTAPIDDYLSVHIRTEGDWTTQFRSLFIDLPQQSDKRGPQTIERDYLEAGLECDVKVLIDGPYGSPAQEYKNYDVVLLVGLGIGATPMISIVKDIVNNIGANDNEERALENGTLNSSPSTPKQGRGEKFKVKRAYFYWVTPSSGSFEWFKGIMNESVEMDKNGVIEMHNHCTSVYEEGDARTTLITMLQSLNRAKKGVDVVSETRIESHFGRPDWRKVYELIHLNHTHQRVGVFYCGQPTLAKQLRVLASDFSHKTSTKFEFHKEIF